MNKDIKPKDRDRQDLREDKYYRCSKHNIPFPKGSSCPACNAEKLQESG